MVDSGPISTLLLEEHLGNYLHPLFIANFLQICILSDLRETFCFLLHVLHYRLRMNSGGVLIYCEYQRRATKNQLKQSLVA